MATVATCHVIEGVDCSAFTFVCGHLFSTEIHHLHISTLIVLSPSIRFRGAVIPRER